MVPLSQNKEKPVKTKRANHPEKGTNLEQNVEPDLDSYWAFLESLPFTEMGPGIYWRLKVPEKSFNHPVAAISHKGSDSPS